MFAEQVANAREAGFDWIECHAAGFKGGVYNGYYTWPRFGYDQELDTLRDQNTAEAAKRDFPEAKTVLDIMKTKEGRDWWKENGADLHKAKFDLREGSRSMKILEAYLHERAKQGR